MKKQIKRKVIESCLGWYDEVSIDDLIEELKYLKEKNATHINFEVIENYEDFDLSIDAICQYIETDEEFDQRKLKEKRLKRIKQKEEIELLKKLKEKYEG